MLLDIDIDLLQPAAGVPVIRPSDITADELREARELGIIRPVIARENTNNPRPGEARYLIVSLSRSWYLAQAAGIQKVPVQLLDAGSAGVTVIAEPSTQKPDNPIAEAMVLDGERPARNKGGIRKTGLSVVAQKRRITLSAASHKLRLLKLVNPVREMVSNGTLKEGHARVLLRLPIESQMRVARAVLRKKLRVRQTEDLVRETLGLPQKTSKISALRGTHTGAKHTAAAGQKDADTVLLERQLSEACGAKVSIEDGVMVVLCGEDVDVLSGILHKLKLSGTGCRAIIDGPRLVVDYANDLEQFDVLLRNIGVTL